ncbi:MAG: hypothetical protein IPJ17_15415 [Holophagales bacterium]|nr:MAG: hypothetical protein IPJ17_15415 [Holophagales bacterium]
MSVQEIGAIHARYVDLSSRFKAGWTYHQFLQGLQNLSVDLDLGKTRVDFQVVYGALKDISQNLTSGVSDKLSMQLEFVSRQLNAQIDALVAVDARVSPSLLRQFFDRVKNQDEKVLAQMVRFFLYLTKDGDWPGDRLDKVDFLITKLAEEASPSSGGVSTNVRDRASLREVFSGFATLAGATGQRPELVERRRQEVVALRGEAAAAQSLEELHQRGLVRRYRDIKHQMGLVFFDAEVLQAIAETNIALKNAVRQFYRLEEQRLVAEYQQLFDLEGRVPTDAGLDREISELRDAVDRFERKQRRDDVKLDELLAIRRQVQSLLPRLSRDEAPLTGDDTQAAPATALRAAAAPAGENEDLLGRYFRRIVDALEATDPDAPAKSVTVLRDVFPLRLEPREVTAYRRLASTRPVDRELEQFVLESAALRQRINEEAEEIMGLLDESAVTRDAPVFNRARQTNRVADSFVQRFQHFMDQSIQDGNFSEAQALQLLRMRLIRDFSGLWLLVNRPAN